MFSAALGQYLVSASSLSVGKMKIIIPETGLSLVATYSKTSNLGSVLMPSIKQAWLPKQTHKVGLCDSIILLSSSFLILFRNHVLPEFKCRNVNTSVHKTLISMPVLRPELK